MMGRHFWLAVFPRPAWPGAAAGPGAARAPGTAPEPPRAPRNRPGPPEPPRDRSGATPHSSGTAAVPPPDFPVARLVPARASPSPPRVRRGARRGRPGMPRRGPRHVVHHAEHSEQVLAVRAPYPHHRRHPLLPSGQRGGSHRPGEAPWPGHPTPSAAGPACLSLPRTPGASDVHCRAVAGCPTPCGASVGIPWRDFLGRGRSGHLRLV